MASWPLLVRLYDRVRRRIVVKWREQNGEAHNYMVDGRPSIDEVWQQFVRDKAVREQGLVSASVPVGLTKAFESVRLDVVLDTAWRRCFPFMVLR